MMTFETLMAGHKSAEIVCLLKGEVVRRLTVKDGGLIEVDVMTEKVTVRMGTPIVCHPVFWDRGNMMFYIPDYGGDPNGLVGKLCTEADHIRFDDGTETHVVPA